MPSKNTNSGGGTSRTFRISREVNSHARSHVEIQGEADCKSQPVCADGSRFCARTESEAPGKPAGILHVHDCLRAGL